MGPPRYGRQAKLETGNQKLETSKTPAFGSSQIWKKFFGFRPATLRALSFEPAKVEFEGVGFTLHPSPFTLHSDALRVALKVIGSSRTGN